MGGASASYVLWSRRGLGLGLTSDALTRLGVQLPPSRPTGGPPMDRSRRRAGVVERALQRQRRHEQRPWPPRGRRPGLGIGLAPELLGALARQFGARGKPFSVQRSHFERNFGARLLRASPTLATERKLYRVGPNCGQTLGI